MAHQNVILERSEGVATLTINRLQHQNAFDTIALTEFIGAVEEIKRDDSLRALIVTGTGDEFFSLGADVAAMVHLSPWQALAMSELGQQMGVALEALPIPTLAAVNGLALGGGCELAVDCDLTIASESAHFGQIETIGGAVIPGFGGTWRLARRVGTQRARAMIFTGEIINARTAVEWGLALEVVPAADLLPRCREITGKIAACGQLAVAQAKRALIAGADQPLAAANAVERLAFASLFGTDDQQRRMGAFLNGTGWKPRLDSAPL